MTFTFDISSNFLRNIRPLEFLKGDSFILQLNDTAVSFPIAVAAGLSTNISKLLQKDSTARKYHIKIDFHNDRNNERIIEILNSSESKINVTLEGDDAVDFAEFGIAFGNDEFIKPLETFEKHMEEGLSIKNILDIIKYKDAFSHYKGHEVDFTKEITYIAQNFSSFAKENKFIEWCKDDMNVSRVESIVRSDDIHLNCEDDLLNFILQINDCCENKFIRLLQYVHLEFCSISSCRAFLEVIDRNDSLQSKNQRESVLLCLRSRLLYDGSAKIDKRNLEDRYQKGDKTRIKVARKKNHSARVSKPADFINDIHSAAEKGKLTSVKYLIEQCLAYVETKDRYGYTPIIIASEKGHLEVVKYLLEECHAKIKAEAN
jgi:hypothetical protein